jgi:hypothetical protein
LNLFVTRVVSSMSSEMTSTNGKNGSVDENWYFRYSSRATEGKKLS